ncbi:hypothetical protein [Glycomyces buryatensis]|uniref:Uncharacterized protein n=1 Tax=Glycomyces buryatensis TaxID=2570927 RepID=A0A4S8Q620_9ACTN|nr:hypothetical protein [Glycomyces buryatensis]THV35714.1 hypothetical protein FAB82_22845 [Glycomyces buryatensis]
MSHLDHRELPCRLCGMDTIVPGRVCWTCRRIAHDAEADASGLLDASAGALGSLWGAVLARHLLRRAVADRTRNGLTPLEPAGAVVVEFEHAGTGSTFATLTAEAFDASDRTRLRQYVGLGPIDSGELLRVHDGRRVFSDAVAERIRAAWSSRPADH